MRLRRRGRWLVAAAVPLAAGGLWWLRVLDGAEPAWSAAERGDLVLGVEVTGTLKAVRTELVGPPQLPNTWQFKIAKLAPEGQEVRAGQPILGFDASELQQRLERERAERDAAQKRVEKAEKELSVLRRQDEMRMAEARSRLRKVQLQSESPAELSAASELALVRLDLELAEREVVYLTERLESAARSAEATLGALRDQLQRAEQQVVGTEREIAQMTVLAGRDGTVIYVQDWNDQKKKVGDGCWRGESVLELPDLTEMKALGMVHEADAGRIAAGQRVRLHLDAHPESEFGGRVSSIWRTVQRESWRSPGKVVRLEIELDETDRRRMRPGMRFRGTIEVERVTAALLVDADAVFAEPEGPVVYRRTALGYERVPVELGRRNDERVEVLGGLEEGDDIALEDPGRPRRSA
jgi:multidrug efflux pump subunit AcrA (membrane-fusion protein)